MENAGFGRFSYLESGGREVIFEWNKLLLLKKLTKGSKLCWENLFVLKDQFSSSVSCSVCSICFPNSQNILAKMPEKVRFMNHHSLGGGFKKYLLFSPLLGEDFPF